MGKSHARVIGFITAIIMAFLLAGCGNMQNVFGAEQFRSDMKSKGYTFEMQDAQQDFLPTTRQRMLIDDKAIDIYIFNSDKEMKTAASHIDSSGCRYQNGTKGVEAGWVSPPHFYKKGTIIVQYVGDDSKITSDLTNIMGEQFAGDMSK